MLNLLANAFTVKKTPKPRQQAQIDLMPLDFDYGHAPADRLGGSPAQAMPIKVRDPDFNLRLRAWAQQALIKLRPDPVRDCETALAHFSADFSRFLVALHGLAPDEPKNVIAVENAYGALGWQAENTALVWRSDFPSLFLATAKQQLPHLAAPALEKMAVACGLLLTGSDIGSMRPLLMRCERRSMGFGWYEDYFKHMSRAEYARFMRELDILRDTAPVLLPQLQQLAMTLAKNTQNQAQ